MLVHDVFLLHEMPYSQKYQTNDTNTMKPTLSPSCTSVITWPVAGSKVLNVLPDDDLCHSLLIKICNT